MTCVGHVLTDEKTGVVLVERGGVPGRVQLGPGGSWFGAVVGRKV